MFGVVFYRISHMTQGGVCRTQVLAVCAAARAPAQQSSAAMFPTSTPNIQTQA